MAQAEVAQDSERLSLEPGALGANLAAIEAGADILAHPGLLTEKEAALAAKKGVSLELSNRGGHSFF